MPPKANHAHKYEMFLLADRKTGRAVPRKRCTQCGKTKDLPIREHLRKDDNGFYVLLSTVKDYTDYYGPLPVVEYEGKLPRW